MPWHSGQATYTTNAAQGSSVSPALRHHRNRKRATLS